MSNPAKVEVEAAPVFLPSTETQHHRANQITLEAIRISRQGRTAAQRAAIYEREISRLMAANPDLVSPVSASGSIANKGLNGDKQPAPHLL
jgi:hypothetical protein